MGKPHGVQRYNKDIDCNRFRDTRDKLDRSGMCCKQLDYINWNVVQYDSVNTVDSDTRSEVVPIRRNEVTQKDSLPSSSRNGPQSHRLTSEPVLTSVRPSFQKRPNVIAVETRKTAGVPTARPVDIVPTPQVIVNENRCIGTVSGEMFPEEPDVVPEGATEGPTNAQFLHDDQNYKKTTITKLPMDFVEIPRPTLLRVSFEVTEEASTDGTTNVRCLYDDQTYKKTTNTKLPTDSVEIPKPMLPRVSVKVAEEASTDGATNEQCLYEYQDYKKTTITKLSMDFLEIPQPSFTRRFLELAEEARNVCVENEQCFLVDEVLPQVTVMTKPVIEPVSWPLEEELGQFVEVTREGPSRVGPVKYEAGHMMQWPDIKADGVMIDGIMLESEMSPVSSVRGAAEPVRVSVLPVVGSELPTGLSAAVVVTEQLVVGLGDTLDKVDHGAGQSCVHIVPVERLPDLCEVRDIMFSWIRPVSYFYLMKMARWICPHALMVVVRHYDRKWTSTHCIYALRRWDMP